MSSVSNLQAPVLPPIVVDTREQRPYRFRSSIRRKLETGDYSLAGYEDRVAIERKSLVDLFGSLGKGRKRFRREVERLAKLDYGGIVVEADLEELLRGVIQSAMSPKAVLQSCLSWSVELGVGVWFAGDRSYGRGLVYHLLRHWWRSAERKEAVASGEEHYGLHGVNGTNTTAC